MLCYLTKRNSPHRTKFAQ